jgi:prepilin-type N-terminal cleavage/methylation domain-containing protein
MRNAPARRGFTLVEVLLVVAILCVVAAVTVPSFVGSLKGNRMRTAVRAVVTAGRYARSMAVLQQKETRVCFDLDAGIVSVGAEVARRLEGVKIEYVETGADARHDKGRCEIAYQANGRCRPYEVRLEGSGGDVVTVRVDALASAKTE